MISKKDRLEITNSWLLNSSEYSEYKKCRDDLKLYIENAVESHLTKEQKLAWDEVSSNMDLIGLAKTQEYYIDFDFLLGISGKSRPNLTTILENGRRDKILDYQAQVFSGVDFKNGGIKIEEDLPFMFRPYAVDADKIKASYPEFYEGLRERAGNYIESLEKINGKLEKIFDLLTSNTTLELVSKNLGPSSNVSELESLLSKDEKETELLCTSISQPDLYTLGNYYEVLFKNRSDEFHEDVRKGCMSKIECEIKKLWNEYIIDTCPAIGELFKKAPHLCKTSTLIAYYPRQVLGSEFGKYLDEQMDKPISSIAALGYISIGVQYSAEEGPIIKSTTKATYIEFIDWLRKNKTAGDLEGLRSATFEYYKKYQEMLDNTILCLDRSRDRIILRDGEGTVQNVKTYKDLLDVDEAAFNMICNENSWTVNKKVSTVGNIPPCNSKREELITLCTERIKDWIN
jgi:hypothetical protein